MWKDELKKKWYLHHYDKEQEYYVTIEEDVIEFIHSLLKQQREICANKLCEDGFIVRSGNIYKNILNAPPPEREEKE